MAKESAKDGLKEMLFGLYWDGSFLVPVGEADLLLRILTSSLLCRFPWFRLGRPRLLRDILVAAAKAVAFAKRCVCFASVDLLCWLLLRCQCVGLCGQAQIEKLVSNTVATEALSLFQYQLTEYQQWNPRF